MDFRIQASESDTGLPALFAAADEAWQVDGTLDRLADGSLGLVEITIRHAIDGRAVSKQMLRDVKVPDILNRARAWSEDDIRARAESASARTAAQQLLRRRETIAVSKPGRKPRPDHHFARVALAYMDLQRQGVGRGILQRLADELGVPRGTASDWVHGARKRGFLTKGSPGKAGAEPGPRYLEALLAARFDPVRPWMESPAGDDALPIDMPDDLKAHDRRAYVDELRRLAEGSGDQSERAFYEQQARLADEQA